MQTVLATTRKVKTAISAIFVTMVVGAFPAQAKDTTAGVIVKEMPSKEFVTFVTGMVEGMAYARFRKDTLAAGQKVETGSQCIRNWYHRDTGIILKIEDAFRKYADYAPWVVLGVMVKNECGE